MWLLKNQNFTEIMNSNVPLAVKIHFVEADLSEAIYSFWCRLNGHRFERKRKQRPNSCILVTKRGFHLFSKIVGHFTKTMIIPSQLETYQMNCPEIEPFGLGKTAYHYRFLKDGKCSHCGRCYKVQKGDFRIVGKF